MMRIPHLRSAAVLPVLLLAGACTAAPPPRAPQPELLLPDTWAAGADTTDPPVANWWTTFGDASLTAAIDEALASNYDLRAAAARVDQAEAAARIAGAASQPQVTGTMDAARNRRNFIGFPIPGSDEGQVLSSTTTNLGVSLNISWEPDLWGRLKSGAVAALADRAAVTALYEGARLSLAAQTAKAWLAVIEARHQVELAERTLDSRGESVARVGLRYEQGLRPAVDLRLSQAAEATAEGALAGRRRQLDAATRQLEVLVGRYPSGTFDTTAPLPQLSAPAPSGLPADLIARRPDLLAAEMALVASGARVAESRAALLPQIRLTGSAGTASEQLLDLLTGDFAVWSFVGGLTQPLFQGGRLRAGVDAAEARREESVAAYAQSALVAFAEVESALGAERFLIDQETALARAFDEAVAARQLSEERYFAGLAQYLDVLDSQRQAFTAESQLLEIRRLRLATRVDLHLALGGDFSDPYALGDSTPQKEFRP